MQAFERTHDTPYPPREARVATRARWDAFARRLREHLRLSLGLTPSLPEPPLRALRTEAHRGDGYRIERFALETLPGFYLTGSLFVPDAPADARAPAMLQPHGHFEGGRLTEADVLRAVALAQAGVYVLSYDMVGYNDQFQLPHWGAEPLEWRRWGFSRAGLQTWNSLCAFEWLRQQREIDPQRIGCSGISGGGTQTFLLSAWEPRLSCAAPVKMVSSVMQGGCICENCSLLRVGTNNIELAALCAPRPQAMTGANDWTVKIEKEGLPDLKKVYGLYDAADRVEAKYFPFPHNYNQPSREMMYNWFNKHLKLGHAEPIAEQPFVPVPPAELRVFDAEHPLPKDAADAAGVRSYLTKQSDRQLAELAKQPEEFRRVVGQALQAMVVDKMPQASEIPLKLVRDCTEIIMEAARAGIGVNVLSMAMAGASAPVHLAGTLVTHNAEVLSGLMLAQLTRKGTPVVYGSSTCGLDMRFGTASVGSPELALISAAVAQLAHRYSLPSFVAGG